MDPRGSIPTFLHVSDARLHDVNALDLLNDVNALDLLIPEPGAFHVMDRAHIDFGRLFLLNSPGAFFVVRAKSNTRYRRRYSRAVDKSTGLRCDQTVVLAGARSRDDYPQPLRRVKHVDGQAGKTFNFLTNHFAVPAATVADLYRHRWKVELFFKWIKQRLHIKSFFGTSENAVKTQIWIAVCVYVLVAIMKKRLGLSTDLYTVSRILSLTLFEKTPLFPLLSNSDYISPAGHSRKQFDLFENLLGH